MTVFVDEIVNLTTDEKVIIKNFTNNKNYSKEKSIDKLY
jgi:hypothetical protein